MSTPEYFARIAGRVNLPLLHGKLVVVVGVGTVGSQITMELARCGVGRFRLVDGDHLEEANRIRHILPQRYVGMNKAAAMTLYLDDEVPGSRPEAELRYVNTAMPDNQLDKLLRDADLIVAATDDREAQRRIGRRALALSVPAIFPALYGDDGGEVIVQLDSRFPCFFCWDGFRTNEERVRGVTALNATTLPVIYTAIRLSLGILDPHSEHQRMMVKGPNQPPNQIFQQSDLAALAMLPLPWRPNCPSCAVGPASQPQAPPPRPSRPSNPEVRSPPRRPRPQQPSQRSPAPTAPSPNPFMAFAEILAPVGAVVGSVIAFVMVIIVGPLIVGLIAVGLLWGLTVLLFGAGH
jgi:molybdopterin/thiamine biosynthesis adenylyltransferase